MKTLAVLTSGGDSPGMNAAIRAVAKVAATRAFRVLGAEEGFDTARAHRRALVVEVMGRQCGYLAMASAVAAGADAVLFREQGRDQDQLIDALAELVRGSLAQRDKRRVLVIKAEGAEIPCLDLVRRLEKRLEASMPQVEIRGTVLGHLVRGGSPSYQDRMVAGRLSFAAVQALDDGATDEMVAWNPLSPGGTQTGDPAVLRFPLADVLAETARLIDGTSPITRRRVQMMEMIEGVLPL